MDTKKEISRLNNRITGAQAQLKRLASSLQGGKFHSSGNTFEMVAIMDAMSEAIHQIRILKQAA